MERSHESDVPRARKHSGYFLSADAQTTNSRKPEGEVNLEKYVVTSLAWLGLLTGITAAQSNRVTTVASAQKPASHYFAIQVVDDQTGRGVPLVDLQTTSDVSYYTDSNGLIA